MKFPSFPLTRRQAFAEVAAGAATSTAKPAQVRTATLLSLKRNSAKELLLKMALTNGCIFAQWSTAIVKGFSRLACYGLDGGEKWSKELGSAPLFAIVTSGDNEVTTVVIERESAKVIFSKYSSLGALNQEDSLPLNEAVLAVGASSADICALDSATTLFIKRFGVPEAPTRMPPAFDTPTIGGVKPRAIVASVHFLGNQLLLLDHVKARTVTILRNGERQPGRLVHPSIEAAVQRQDSDVEARIALLRPSGNERAVTFPINISLAASDRANGIWVVSSVGTRTIPILRFNSALGVTATYDIQVPADPVVKHGPPLMLAASQSVVALGFREGVVALVDHRGQQDDNDEAGPFHSSAGCCPAKVSRLVPASTG